MKKDFDYEKHVKSHLGYPGKKEKVLSRFEMMDL